MPRRLRLFAVAGVLLLAAGTAAVASASVDEPADLCGRYQTMPVKNGRYIVMNNVWGATTGQCLEVDADGAFAVRRSEHRNAGTAAAYPSVYTGCHWGHCTAGTTLPLRVDHLRSARSTWHLSADADGVWNAAYDLWFHTTADINRSPDGAEIMIWLDRAGGANPGGSIVARNVRLGGATWDVWHADWEWNYIAYVRTKPTSSVRNLDLKAFTLDAVARGFVRPTWYLSGIEAGFEVWRDGTGLRSESFSATAEGTGAPVVRADPSTSASPSAGGPAAPAPPTATPRPTGAATRCSVRWTSTVWSTGMVAQLSLVNHGKPLAGWSVSWRFRGDERVTSTWGAEITQTGRAVVARNAPYNAQFGTGERLSFGFQADHRATPRRPIDFRLNGNRCGWA